MPRARKPRALHALAGTQPQYVTPDESAFKGGKPKKPKDLPPVASAEWDRIVKQLQKRGTLTCVDASALEVYCRMFSRWKTVALLAEESPTVETSWTVNEIVHTKIVENPASKIAARLEISLRAYQHEFGATPVSREKAKRVEPEKKKDEYPVDSLGWWEQNYARLKAEQQPAPGVAALPPVEPAPVDDEATNFDA
jgi:P27 family predicted phage terminase small subunit